MGTSEGLGGIRWVGGQWGHGKGWGILEGTGGSVVSGSPRCAHRPVWLRPGAREHHGAPCVCVCAKHKCHGCAPGQHTRGTPSAPAGSVQGAWACASRAHEPAGRARGRASRGRAPRACKGEAHNRSARARGTRQRRARKERATREQREHATEARTSGGHVSKERATSRCNRERAPRAPPAHLGGVGGQHGLHGEGAAGDGVAVVGDVHLVGPLLGGHVLHAVGAAGRPRLHLAGHGAARGRGDAHVQPALPARALRLHGERLLLPHGHLCVWGGKGSRGG